MILELLQPLLPSLNLPIIAIYVLLMFVVLAFFREWGTPDLVALGALGAVLLLGLLPLSDVVVDDVIQRRGLLSVFSNGAPITIACMFVLSAGLERTGAIDVMGRFFMRIAGKSELRVMLVMMLMAAVLSAFVNADPLVVCINSRRHVYIDGVVDEFDYRRCGHGERHGTVHDV